MTAPVARQQLGASTGNRKWYLDVNTSDGRSISFTADAVTDALTADAHGMANGQPVTMGATPPAGLTAGTTYYVRDAAAGNFKLAATVGGPAVDITTSGSGTLTVGPTWTGVHGITELTPGAIDANLENDSDFDGGGFGSQTKTGESWSVSLKLARKVRAALATAYDPGQEFLRTKSFGTFGPANSVAVRWYEMEDGGPRVEAYEGRAAVVWNPDGGPHTALSTVSVTLTGQGRLRLVPHPAAA